jgi:hypothetical protein
MKIMERLLNRSTLGQQCRFERSAKAICRGLDLCKSRLQPLSRSAIQQQQRAEMLKIERPGSNKEGG